MKPNSLLLLALLLSLPLAAQDQKIHSYYDKYWKRVDNSAKAKYYRVVNKKDGKYFVKDYFMSGKLQSEIVCTGVEPNLKFDSKLTLFHENGTPSRIGFFKDENPYGFHEYFFENGSKHQEVTFRDGKQIYHQIWNEKGEPLLSNGNGFVTDDDTPWGTSHTIYKDSVALATYAYDEQLQDTVYSTSDVLPEYPGGYPALAKNLRSALKYPTSARKANRQGMVFVAFVVTKTGEAKNWNIIRGVADDLDAEALRAVSTLGNWSVGTFRSKPVNFRYILPVQFKLH